jgi:NAD(P)-dependent dehydrogenase (short-subunit alcohol dehydrogenase family)
MTSSTERFQLDGTVAVVTGGTGVLGSAMVEGLADAGAKVGILGRRKNVASELSEEIRDQGGEAIPLKADVLKREDLERAREKTLDEWGSLDVLVNCAGGNMDGATLMPDEDMFDLKLSDFEDVMNLNLMGTVRATQVFAEPMVEQDKGSIINISSMAAQQALTRVCGYSASKAGVDNFTRWMSVEMANKFGEGLRINAIAPGFFIGEQNRDLLLNDDGSLSERGQTIIDNTPMDRFGEPEDLIGTVVWLASDASKFVTGIVVPVDGGFSAYSGV